MKYIYNKINVWKEYKIWLSDRDGKGCVVYEKLETSNYRGNVSFLSVDGEFIGICYINYVSISSN